MTPTEKAIREFCGHHADWWPSTTQVQEMLALAQPCPTCEALARTVMLDQTSHDNFKPDWDAMAVMVEEQQRMAKRIEELEAKDEPVAWGVFEGNLHDMFFSQEEAQEMARLKGSHAEVRPLYTTPPQRTWVGLTKDEKETLSYKAEGNTWMAVELAEAKLKEKNT